MDADVKIMPTTVWKRNHSKIFENFSTASLNRCQLHRPVSSIAGYFPCGTTEPFPGSLNCLQDWLTVASIPIPFLSSRNHPQYHLTVLSIDLLLPASLNNFQHHRTVFKRMKFLTTRNLFSSSWHGFWDHEKLFLRAWNETLFPAAERKIFVSNCMRYWEICKNRAIQLHIFTVFCPMTMPVR